MSYLNRPSYSKVSPNIMALFKAVFDPTLFVSDNEIFLQEAVSDDTMIVSDDTSHLLSVEEISMFEAMFSSNRPAKSVEQATFIDGYWADFDSVHDPVVWVDDSNETKSFVFVRRGCVYTDTLRLADRLEVSHGSVLYYVEGMGYDFIRDNCHESVYVGDDLKKHSYYVLNTQAFRKLASRILTDRSVLGNETKLSHTNNILTQAADAFTVMEAVVDTTRRFHGENSNNFRIYHSRLNSR